MKRILTAVIALMLICLALVSCGGNNQKPDDTTPQDTTTAKDTKDTSKDTKKDDKSTTTDKTPDTTPEKKEAFSGTIDEVLDLIVNKATELDKSEYGIGGIKCYHSPVDTDVCDVILGLDDKEFAEYVEAAVESKPEGSWFTHSVVVVKLKDGVDVKAVAEKIVSKTEAVRFGCLRPQAIVGAYTGNYVVFTTSDSSICEVVFEAVKALSGADVTRVDRTKDWSDSGLME